MIRWCSYCQAFLGESAPFDDAAFTHGVCAPCDEKVGREEPLVEATAPVRGLMRRILHAATTGDRPACATFLAEARKLGLGADSLLVGLLQPALYQVGLDWCDGVLAHEAEHRFTSWCESVFALLPPLPAPRAPIDLLIYQTPGNLHTLGQRFATRVLSERALQVELVEDDLSWSRMAARARELQPRFIGFSCAISPDVRAAEEAIRRLRQELEPAYQCRYLLAGFALRQGDSYRPLPGVEIVRDLDFFAYGSAASSG